MTLSLMVMEVDGFSSVVVMKNVRCFIGRFTESSDLELPNSTVIGMV